ncbi:TetR/AcrR family transcriptional regulator [Nocardioides sp. SOB77]|uniref:TetR/AcrR family transcriptional regulator n=1 Tax=Nocardioides oceani TaxID=3058369 RepID=A0ABT8FKB4_9ACTN|nr:TetR/AcrR family transcriptional regulator [Nocardioides oceani]MDN4175111.1 TetR/AcrR family transcriptional regulator [Nocardioides oceani]
MAGAAERVREAALDLFADRGFHGVGIRQLAERAGLSSASLYHYMGTKEDLLAAIMRACLERLLADAEAAAAAHADPVARVEALVRAHVVSHAERPRETRVVDGELAALTGETRAEVVALRDRYERVWQDAIDAGAAAGAFAVGSPAVARRALLEMCSGVARWYDPAGPIPLTELADLYAAMARQLLGVRA